mgnify:CR=1 FL=1
MSKELSGRVALITGASAGIGEALARDFAARGARLVINARRAQRLDALRRELEAEGAACVAVPGDCADPAVVEALVAAPRGAFGAPADLVVVNAGRGLAGSVLTSDPAQWEEVVRTNLLGAAALMRAAAGAMLDGLTAQTWLERAHDIVVLGSVVGRHVSPFSSMYGSTKFAVHSLAEALRREIGPRGVRVTLVEPAVVVSEFQAVAGYTDELVAGFQQKFGPLLEPRDIARSIAFIAAQPPSVHISDIVIRATRQDYP